VQALAPHSGAATTRPLGQSSQAKPSTRAASREPTRILNYDEFAMKQQVQNALNVLIGQPQWSSGRAADLEWFSFGQRRTVKGPRGTKEVGEYALHIQCAWRITHGDQVVVGSHDLYYPSEERDTPVNEFDWDVQGANLRDRRIAELFQNETRQFLVREVEVGKSGTFSIIFDDEYVMDVFPDNSRNGEHWRMLKPYADEPHFVVSGKELRS
jgi:hypothetical protein